MIDCVYFPRYSVKYISCLYLGFDDVMKLRFKHFKSCISQEPKKFLKWIKKHFFNFQRGLFFRPKNKIAKIYWIKPLRQWKVSFHKSIGKVNKSMLSSGTPRLKKQIEGVLWFFPCLLFFYILHLCSVRFNSPDKPLFYKLCIKH